MSSIFLMLSVMMAQMDTLQVSRVEKLLSSSFKEWNVAGPVRRYSGEQIYDYMDGAGEVFLSYNFKHLIVQRYVALNQEELLVELFDMETSANAFGICTYMLGRGATVDIGQDGEYKSGLLTFWQDFYFVCVKIEEETEKSKIAVNEIGALISDAIKAKGEQPSIIRLMPLEEGLPKTIRYFYTKEILNYHFFLADENILNLGKKTEACLLRLRADKSYLLMVHYRDVDEATNAYKKFLKSYMTDAKGGEVAMTGSGYWTVCDRRKEYVLILFNAVSGERAKETLTNVVRRLP
jgi:hypothetical protein